MSQARVEKSSSRSGHAAMQSTSPPAQELWDKFWFTPHPDDQLVRVQRIVYTIAAVWFMTLLAHNDFWWGSAGLNAAKFAGQLEAYAEGATGSRFRISPLWLTDSAAVIAGWCIVGVVLSVTSAMNKGGRWLRAICTIWILCLVQRASWTLGLLEPTLVALCSYLAFARIAHSVDWSNGFATRLIQVHLWLLLVAALASQLSYDAWWQGEAAWWLVVNDRSTLLSSAGIEGRILLVNVLTHAITLATATAVGCLWPWATEASPLRARIGIGAAFLVALAYALLADQLLYGCLLAASVLVWRKPIKASDLGLRH